MINRKILYVLLVMLPIVGCSTYSDNKFLDNRPNYKVSKASNPLEIPPDLTQSSIDDVLVVPELTGIDNVNLSTYKNDREKNSPKKNNLESSLKNIHRSGDAAWIEINDKPDIIFDSAKDFWLGNGLELSRVDKNLGIMETDWLEVANDLPKTGVSRLISTIISPFTDSGLRDKFRTRIDYDGKKTYVYLTHYRATKKEVDFQNKVVKQSVGGAKKEKYFSWVTSSRSPELEVEMLRRLNLYLNRKGQENVVSKSANKANGSGTIKFSKLADGTPILVIDSSFNKAWMLLGIAIDRAGYSIESQERKNGIYSFAKIENKKVGFIFSKIDRKIDSYTVGLADQGNKQVAVVRSHNNGSVSIEEAKAILQRISKEIRF